MARARVIQNAFTGGELSPRLAGRTDLEVYHRSAKELTNAVVFKQGGVKRREGTKFIHEVKTSAKFTRLVTFAGRDYGIAAGDWLLEIGDLYIRFYINGVSGLTFYGTADIVTPWTESMLRTLNFQYVQVENVMYFTVGQLKPYQLTLSRSSIDVPVFTFAAVDFHDGPFLPTNGTSTTLDPTGTTGTITITSSAAVFTADHVGSTWRIGYDNAGTIVWGDVLITFFYSSTSVLGTVIGSALFASTATLIWAEGAWSTERGSPVSVTHHQGRLVFGGTDYQPSTIWASRVGIINPAFPLSVDMSPGTGLDDEAYTFTLDDTRSIRWLRGGDRALRVGASNVVGQLQTQDGIITAGNPPDRTVQSGFGSNDVAPVKAHNAVLFLQVGGRILREVVYEFSSESYVAVDMNSLSDLITGDGIVDMAFQQEPDSIIWAARDDGVLLGLTYERPNQVVAWHRHVTDGEVESLCVLRHSEEKQFLYMVVNRTIGGSTKRYIERLDREFTALPEGETGGGYYGALQVDSAVVYSGVSTGTITGLTHLEGEEVDILGNGLVYPRQTVTGGQVTGLDPGVTVAEVGLPFETTIIPMPFELATGSGVGQTARKRFSTIFVRVFESAGFTLNETQLQTRFDLGGTPELITEDVEVQNMGWSRDGLVTIRQTQPLPLTVLAYIGVLNQED